VNGPGRDADDWDSHWDDFTSAASRNPAQEYRRRLALQLLEEAGPPSRVLDVGSGQGDFLVAARRRWPDAELAGLEASENGVRETRGKVPAAAVHVCDLLAGDPPVAGLAGWATHAVCSEVLEHVDDPVALMRNATAYLAGGCRVVVTVPGGRMSAFDRHIGHRRHFTPRELADVLAAAGLEVRWAAGAGFPFFNLYRALVIARGERLVADVSAASAEQPGAGARLAMAAFRPLFRLNRTRSRWGKQIVAVAARP
jgi:SAM-dependent methyltransferase